MQRLRLLKLFGHYVNCFIVASGCDNQSQWLVLMVLDSVMFVCLTTDHLEDLNTPFQPRDGISGFFFSLTLYLYNLVSDLRKRFHSNIHYKMLLASFFIENNTSITQSNA